MDSKIIQIITKDNNAIVQVPFAQLSWYQHNMSVKPTCFTDMSKKYINFYINFRYADIVNIFQ
jgi:hypothetical protein